VSKRHADGSLGRTSCRARVMVMTSTQRCTLVRVEMRVTTQNEM